VSLNIDTSGDCYATYRYFVFLNWNQKMEQVSGHDVGPIYPTLYNYPKKTILLPSDWRNLGGIWQNPTFPNNSGSIDSGVAELVIWALAKRLRWLGPVWLGDCFDRRWGEDTSPSFLPFLAGDETFLAQKTIMVAWRQRNCWRVWTTAYENLWNGLAL
jgi:hypothetical protein